MLCSARVARIASATVSASISRTWSVAHRLSSSIPVRQQSEHLELSLDNGVARLTFNRPKLHNAFNEHVIADVTSAVKHFDGRDDVRALVLSGNGKSFSAGADLNWMRKMAQYTREENVQDSQALFGMFAAIQNFSKPVVGRINGSCFGGGVGLVAVCDIAFAASHALFGFTEMAGGLTSTGLVPAVISPFVTQKIGLAHASRYFLTAETFNASTAEKMNLVQKVCENEADLDAEVETVLKAINIARPQAVARCKKMLQQVAAANEPSSVRDFVVGQIADARVSEEAQAQLAAFLEQSTKGKK